MSIYKYILPTAIFFIGILIISSVKNLFFGFEAQLFYAIECSSYWFFLLSSIHNVKEKQNTLFPICHLAMPIPLSISSVICYLANRYTEESEKIIILRPLVTNIFLAIITQLLLIYKKRE